MSTLAGTLRSWLGQEIVVDRRARAAVGVLAFALAIALGAQVAVYLPFTPVPITLQTLFVVLAGVVLGPRLGALAAGAYVAVGAAGAPIFANGAGGLAWLMGPTGGYLLAAPLAALVAGSVGGRGAGALRTAAGLALGVLTMYVGGVTQLQTLTGEPWGAVLALGVYPFLAGDAVKLVAALWIVRGARATSFGRF
ncbi:MAG TPA: biotin transporter BioY [Longimicrobiales bacterium]|nr:biotin transporter BioY [Longimicrobiales bacterium]